MQLILGRTPASVAVVGSGAMPETVIWIADWAQKNGQPVNIYSLEVIPSRSEQGKKVCEKLGVAENITFAVGDIKDTPKDLSAHDVVWFNAAVGTTTLEKENILLDVIGRMRKGSFLLTRSTHSLKTMAYPVSLSIQTISYILSSSPFSPKP